MRLGQLQKRESITESWNDPQWTLFEHNVVHPWVASVEQYVQEAMLSPDQINQLFKGVEQGAVASGGNRTAIGKGVDVAKLPVEAIKWIDQQINKLGAAVQKAGPVQNLDAKFDELKTKIGQKDSKVVQAVKAVSDWAKENPGKASVAVAVLTIAAAVAGGPLGGAVAGFLSRATKDVLQGQKLSTAVGKSVKTAAYGALAGAAIQGISDNIIDNIAAASEAEADAMMNGFEKANFTAAVDKAVADAGFDSGVLNGAQNLELSGNINAFYYNYDLTMTPDQVAQYKALSDAASSAKAFSPEYYEAAGRLHGFLSTTQEANKELTALAKTVMEIPKDALTGEQLDQVIAVLDNADEAMGTIQNIGGAAAAAAQGALQTVDAENKQKHKVKPISPEEKAELKGGEPQMASRVYTGRKLSEGQVYLLFNKIATVNDHMLENKLMYESVFDAVRHQQLDELTGGVKGALQGLGKGIAKGAAAVGGALKGAGKQLTNKVTAEKLLSAWKKAGSPTDSDEVYDVIKSLGVNDDVIKGTYDSMKIEPPKVDAPDADADSDAEKTDTTAGAPTDATAGDAGGDAAVPGADEPAQDNTATGTDAAADQDDNVADPEKATAGAEGNPNPAVKPGTKVVVKTRKGKEIPATTTSGSIGKYDADKYVEVDPDGPGGNFPAQVANMTTPDGKPVPTSSTSTRSGSPDQSAEKNIAATGNPVGAPDNAQQGGSNAAAAAAGAAVGAVDLQKIADQIKKLGPEGIESAKKLLAA